MCCSPIRRHSRANAPVSRSRRIQLARGIMASHTLSPFPEELLAAKKQIRERARSYGLDFFPVIFEMCDYEQMNQIAAYGGFPQPYPHPRVLAQYKGNPQP